MLRNILIIGIVSLSLAAATVSSDDIDLEKLKSQIPDGILPDAFYTSSLPSPEDAKKLFKEKCQKVANNDDAFIRAENASEVFKECLTGLVDFEALQKEIDKAQPNDDLDTVFNKYCRRRTTAIDCMKEFTVAFEPCLDEKEKEGKTTFVKIFTNLLNFICHKDGDQIALFIAEKGPECFNNKKDALMHCINSTMSGYVPSEAMQQCIVKELESCEESTPANLVESMFKFVRNETPCANMTLPNSSNLKGNPNAAIKHQTSWTILSTAALALVARTILL